ncbi:MAG TPA: hypothetical protein VGM92_12980 [Candidatus Kapabacteria bacterium]|jgi:hypothetical protein
MPDNSEIAPNPALDILRVKLDENQLSFETIKSAIYAHARFLYEQNAPFQKLLVSKDLFEILNRRMVFKTAAHRDHPHFITPYGNLEVEPMTDALDEQASFIIQ